MIEYCMCYINVHIYEHRQAACRKLCQPFYFQKKLKTEPVGKVKIKVLFGAKPHSFSTLGSIQEIKSTRLGLPKGSNEDEAR